MPRMQVCPLSGDPVRLELDPSEWFHLIFLMPANCILACRLVLFTCGCQMASYHIAEATRGCFKAPHANMIHDNPALVEEYAVTIMPTRSKNMGHNTRYSIVSFSALLIFMWSFWIPLAFSISYVSLCFVQCLTLRPKGSRSDQAG